MTKQDIFEKLRQEINQLPGHVGVYYKDLSSGEEVGINENDTYIAASVIKLPLYLHVLEEAAAGRLDMGEKLTVTAEDKVPICGALTLFSGDVDVDIATLCRLMISLSDNTATNKLIGYFGVEELHKAFKNMGLEKTVLNRKLFDMRGLEDGIRNVICPKEIGQLLEQLYLGSFVNEAVCKEAIELLQLQQIDHKLNGKLCNAVPVAHKTGEDDGLSHDAGIIYAEKPFILCFAGEDTDVYHWEDLIRRTTYELYQLHKQ